MRSPTHAQEGIKRAWRLACAHEKINPSTPKHLPLIFSIDSLLNIEDGFKYAIDCKSPSTKSDGSGVGYCAGHIGCAGGCAGDSGSTSVSDSGGFFDGFGSGSDCGGGGCGGD